MEFFLKHKTVIFRTLGVVFLLTGFLIKFWVMPQEAVSQNDRAAANLARIEASVAGVSHKSAKKKVDNTHFLKKLKDTQKKQLEYLTILAMILGSISLGYSFVGKSKETKSDS